MKMFLLLILHVLLLSRVHTQSIGIGTKTPNSSAILEVTSTTKGLLPPRMTLNQRNAIVNPVAGLTIWCSDCDELQVYNGTIWKNMSGEVASGFAFPNVKICDQVWAVTNLQVSNYQNGDPIPYVADAAIWTNLTIGAWCWYNNDSLTYHEYGKLYNMYAINDARGLAPKGWHIPTSNEWNTLASCLNGSLVAGGRMKEASTAHWQTPNTDATNSSGFTGLAAGYANASQTFFSQGQYGRWWTSSPQAVSYYYSGSLYYTSGAFQLLYNHISNGLSIRCIKN